MNGTGPEIRAALAAAVEAVVPDEWTVYAGPPEAMSLPGAVVAARSPYRAPGTFCASMYSLAVSLLVSRSQGVPGLDACDDLAVVVADALAALGGVLIASTDLGPVDAPGGVEAQGAILNLELYPTD